MWIVYSEIFDDCLPERYFYGSFDDRNKANEIAEKLNQQNDTRTNIDRVFYGVCDYKDAVAIEVQELPPDLH